MARVFYGIYIGIFIMALIVAFLSNDQKCVNSAVRVLNDGYDLFKVCLVTLLYAILSQLEKMNRTKSTMKL
jgi:hypothetical protein